MKYIKTYEDHINPDKGTTFHDKSRLVKKIIDKIFSDSKSYLHIDSSYSFVINGPDDLYVGYALNFNEYDIKEEYDELLSKFELLEEYGFKTTSQLEKSGGCYHQIRISEKNINRLLEINKMALLV